MKRILFSVLLLPLSLLGADPIPMMLSTNSAIYGGQTNFFLINGELMTNALVALGYSPGVGGGSVASTDITDSTVAGRALLTAVDAAAQRTALELGTAAQSSADDFATDIEVAAAITANTNFAALNVGTMVVDNFSVGTTNVPAELALKANALNTTTTGTFTHNVTNAIITSSNAVFNIGKANALVIESDGDVGIGSTPPNGQALAVTGNFRSSGVIYSAGTADAASSIGGSGISTLGGIYSTKAVSASQYLIRSNAPSTAAARGANALVQEFNTNQWRVIATDAATNEMVLATLNTNGLLTVPSLTVPGTTTLAALVVPSLTATNLLLSQAELQPFSTVTNYVADFSANQQQVIYATNLVVKFLHATNVVAGGMKSFLIFAGTNATVSVELPRPNWICNTNIISLAANQGVAISLTGYTPASNTNVWAVVGPIQSR